MGAASSDASDTRQTEDVQLADRGAGPLLQRDYWAAIADCRVNPVDLMDDLRRRFCEFPPTELVSFRPSGPIEGQPLEVGAELDIHIRMAGACRVRVTASDAHSFTFATLKGHPEAGRITFGSYRHDSGAVIFHIRGRARSGSLKFATGFVTLGEAMQTNTWTDFVRTVAATYGSGVDGEVHAETAHAEPDPADGDPSQPTFAARGTD